MNKHTHPTHTVPYGSNKQPINIECETTGNHIWLHCQQIDNTQQKDTLLIRLLKLTKAQLKTRKK